MCESKFHSFLEDYQGLHRSYFPRVHFAVALVTLVNTDQMTCNDILVDDDL